MVRLVFAGVDLCVWEPLIEPWKIQVFSAQVMLGLRDVPLWALLLGLFGMNKDARWRTWTARLITLYLAAQVVDLAVISFWEHGGLAFLWVDAITTCIYITLSLYPVVILAGVLERRQQLFNLPVGFFAGPYNLYYFAADIPSQGQRFTHWTFGDRLLTLALDIGGYSFSVFFMLQVLLFLAIVYSVGRRIVELRSRQCQRKIEMSYCPQSRNVRF